jgi:transcriptional regulator with XRE-family HTH domain
MAPVLDRAPAAVVAQLEEELHLTGSELAKALNTNPRTIDRWKAGTRYPQHEARQKLTELEALVHRLCSTFTTREAIWAWLREDSRYLGGMAPIDALRAGRFDRANAALEALDSGVFL